MSGDLAAGFGSANDDSGVTVPVGSWEYVAMTYDGHTYGNISFYMNGAQVASMASSASGMVTDSTAVHIGASPGGGEEDFSGSMDEVRLFDRALSASEISQLYQSS